jgi:hypothetical protein
MVEFNKAAQDYDAMYMLKKIDSLEEVDLISISNIDSLAI